MEFWSCRQGPSIDAIPHLNKLHDDYGSKGFAILSLTKESAQDIETFAKRTSTGRKTPVKYAIGTGSKLAADYGVTKLPRAFLIGKDGKVLWDGNPSDKDLEQHIKDAMK